jgi:hypothetical protein
MVAMSEFTINEYIFGIFTGLSASLIVLILAFAKRAIKKIGIVVVLRKSKILYIYENESEAKKDIYKRAKASKKIYAFVTRSTCEFAETNTKYNKLLRTEFKDIRFLFVRPESQYAKDRGDEINIFPEQVVSPIKVMDGICQKYDNVKFALHDESIRLKFFIFDDVMYLYFKTKEEASTNTQIFKVGKESYLFRALSQQFNDYWEKYYKESSQGKSEKSKNAKKDTVANISNCPKNVSLQNVHLAMRKFWLKITKAGCR